MIGLVVTRVGAQALVQDAGRPGLRAWGVPTGGPADWTSHEIANALVGNDPGAGTLELLLGGIGLRAARELALAVAGAPCAVTVDGAPAPFAEPFAVHTGQLVEIGPATWGLRTYVGVAGGVTGEPTLGSVASDPVTGLGPAPLRADDVVEVGHPGTPVAWGLTIPHTVPRDEVVLPATWGPRADWFDDATRAVFASAAWRVSPVSDRVGVRLEGPSLARRHAGELASEGLLPGSVQVPPSGLPIVFGPDSPTTGGYPVIAVCDPDAWGALWQARPGATVRFAMGLI